MSLDSSPSDTSSVVHAADFESEQSALACLRTVRPLLLQLHKALMEAARLSYESNYGPILSKGDYFRLVIDNEWFQWLRPFSQFIVRIDERLAAKKPSEAENAEGLILGTKKLLSPASEGATPEHPYYQLMQQHPEIAMIHAQIIRLLDSVDSLKPSAHEHP
jgi:hypothetical protein